MKRFLKIGLVALTAVAGLTGCSESKAVKQAKIDQAKETINAALGVTSAGVYSINKDFKVPVKLDNETVDVSWSSPVSNLAVGQTVTSNFVPVTITLPAQGAADLLVDLTATLTYKDLSDTYVIHYKLPAPQAGMTVASIRAISGTAKTNPTPVTAQLTVIGAITDGFYGVDAASKPIYVYCGSAQVGAGKRCDVKNGDVVKVEGTKDLYFGLVEIVDNAAGPLTVTKLPSATPVVVNNTNAQVATIVALKSSTDGITNEDNYGKRYTVTGKVVKNGSNYELHDLTDDAKYVQVYYKSFDVNTLEAQVGKTIQVDVLTYSYHSSGYWQVQLSLTPNIVVK